MQSFAQVVLFLAISIFSVSCGTLHKIEGSDSWRSPQPDGKDLRFLHTHGVKTVICLRRPHPELEWYQEESRICSELGMNFVTLSWSALRCPPVQIERLLKTFKEKPGPYLIHCEKGVDRTGLAAAIYRVVILGHSKQAASEELSVCKGHLPLFAGYAMDRAFEEFDWSIPGESRLTVR